jgi:NADPH:quinone reductase-like Zn-dependent oxidoreductase
VEFVERAVPAPGPNEVQVDIRYIGMNFRDVMLAVNMLPEASFEASYFGRSMGMEAAGLVSAVGMGVRGISVGDRVFTSGKHCMGNRANVDAGLVWVLPESLPLEVGSACMPAPATAQ